MKCIDFGRRFGLKVCMGLVLAVFAVGQPVLANDDVENSKDHPLFSRMKNFYIDNYEHNFDLVEFTITAGDDEKEMAVEGQTTRISYWIKDDASPPSAYQIVKNHVSAGQQIGAKVVEKGREKAVMHLIKDGRETWIVVQVHNGGESYLLTVVQSGDMKQEVKAGELLEALDKDGHVAVYINFASNSAVLDESASPVIREIVGMLKENPDLRVKVEGHTDSTGDAEANRRLSRDRAEAVVGALTGAGIAKERLMAAGHGASRPVADNATEAGRAKNRRVELVKI
ncbi:MAG: OmpA family protein [Deltaproteobacteria bacterium]|nr:OmpA family protein [Deltaproteobacteria bacterium]